MTLRSSTLSSDAWAVSVCDANPPQHHKRRSVLRHGLLIWRGSLLLVLCMVRLHEVPLDFIGALY